MDEEIKAIKKNDTWELATLPTRKKTTSVKWVYKLKKNAKGEVERYKARLVVKGYILNDKVLIMMRYLPQLLIWKLYYC